MSSNALLLRRDQTAARAFGAVAVAVGSDGNAGRHRGAQAIGTVVTLRATRTP